MEWTDGMEYQLTKIAKTHHCGRGEVVSAVSTIASTITVRETTALLVAYSQVAQADPSESCNSFDRHPMETRAESDHIHHHALIASYT